MKLPADLPEEVAALVAQANPDAAARLLELAASDDRALAKAARRALFLLRQRGIEPPPREAPPPQSSGTSPRSIAVAYLAPNAARQQHYLFLSPADLALPGALVVLSSFGVLVECRPSIPALATLDRDMRRNGGQGLDGMLQVSVEHATYFVEDGVRAVREAGGLVPPGYHNIRSRFSTNVSDLGHPPIYDFVSEGELQSDPLNQYPAKSLVARYHELADELPKDVIEACAGRMVSAIRSPIVVSEHIQASRLRDILNEAVATVFTAERIARFIRRLELDACIAWLYGYADAARAMAYHARAGRRASSPVEWGLAAALVEHRVQEVVQATVGRESGAVADEVDSGDGPRIIVPGR